jgi:hypothetical protein
VYEALCYGGSLPLEATTPHTLLGLFLRPGILHVTFSLCLVADDVSRDYPQFFTAERSLDILDYVPVREDFHVLAGS